MFHNLAHLKTAMFAQEQFLNIEATKNIVFGVKKDFKHCFFQGFQIANFAPLQKVKEFKTSKFAIFERSLYLILTIFKISNFKTSKDKTSKLKLYLVANGRGGSGRSFLKLFWDVLAERQKKDNLAHMLMFFRTFFYAMFCPLLPFLLRGRRRRTIAKMLKFHWFLWVASHMRLVWQRPKQSTFNGDA